MSSAVETKEPSPCPAQHLSANRSNLFVADWYKVEQPKAKVKDAIMETLDADLSDSYDKEVFSVKTDLLLNRFIGMAVQGYGWVGSVA